MNADWSDRLARWFKYSDLMIAMAVLAIVVMLILPLPIWLIDTALVVNITVAVIIALISVNITAPLQFSVFPSLLLVTTLFRLGLSVAATKLILGTGQGGHVIETFGKFVVQGDFIVGVVAFLILVVVQFVVITNGAGRVAEVAARFTLDALPGKQMSIDADLSAGMIDETEAKERRKKVQQEADFYGAMDGASKFVKGDAIAAIIMIIINIVGGFAVGYMRGQGDAVTVLQTYTLLTIGEGLVAQVPALLISTATGLMVTRAASDQAMGQDLLSQIGSQPRALLAAGAAVMTMSLVPGFPKLQFIVIGGLIAAIGFFASRGVIQMPGTAPKPEALPEAPPPLSGPEAAMSLLKVDVLELEIGYGLMPLVESGQRGDLLERIAAVRRQLAVELGFVMPTLRVRDNLKLKTYQYQIKLRGEKIAEGEVLPRSLLAMPSGSDAPPLQGSETKDPVFNMTAYWIEPAERDRAERNGYTIVEPSAVIATHITEVVRRSAAELLGRQETQQLLENLKRQNAVVVEELVPGLLSLGEVQKALQGLLEEGVPIRNLVSILESLADCAAKNKDPDALVESARAALARAITHRATGGGPRLDALTLAPQFEAELRQTVQHGPNGVSLLVSPDIAERLFTAMEPELQRMTAAGSPPVLLCSGAVRLPLRRLLSRRFANLSVLAYHEVSADTELRIVGQVEIASDTALAA
ncbi:MAG: flagellar biosynthesis protein FlhA [Armatimonadetes bacterium]|nr:flagellar biosynthesis protein FlhA [Armatimonadota bacterium]